MTILFAKSDYKQLFLNILVISQALKHLEWCLSSSVCDVTPDLFCPSVFPYPVPPIEENVLDEGKLLKPWDTKKVKTA